MNAPIDQTHADCLAARDVINQRARFVQRQIAAWSPRPCPPEWKPTR